MFLLFYEPKALLEDLKPLKHPYRLVKEKKVISRPPIEEGAVNLFRYIRRGYPIVENQPKAIGLKYRIN